jgi:hypothetical protein
VLNAAQTEVGQYIADPAATSTVLTLPASSQNAADYTIKVRSEVTGENLSTPFPLSTVSFLLFVGWHPLAPLASWSAPCLMVCSCCHP